MKLILAGRREGKTHKLIEILKSDPGAFFLTHHRSQIPQLVEEYRLTPEQTKRMGTMQDLLGSSLKGRRASSVLLDNLEQFILNLCWQSFGPFEEIVATATDIQVESVQNPHMSEKDRERIRLMQSR